MKNAKTLWTLSLGAALLTAGCTEEARDEELPAPQVADASAQEVDPWPEAAVREVLALAQADERVRGQVAALLQSNSQDTAAFRRAAAEQQSVDQANTARLKELIRQYGFPSKADVGFARGHRGVPARAARVARHRVPEGVPRVRDRRAQERAGAG
jgi:hypothetical protein